MAGASPVIEPVSGATRSHRAATSGLCGSIRAGGSVPTERRMNEIDRTELDWTGAIHVRLNVSATMDVKASSTQARWLQAGCSTVALTASLAKGAMCVAVTSVSSKMQGFHRQCVVACQSESMNARFS